MYFVKWITIYLLQQSMLRHPHPVMYKKGLKEDQEGKKMRGNQIKLETFTFFSLLILIPLRLRSQLFLFSQTISLFSWLCYSFSRSLFIANAITSSFISSFDFELKETEKRLDSRDWTWISFAAILISCVSFCLHRSEEETEGMQRNNTKEDRTLSRQTWSCRHL